MLQRTSIDNTAATQIGMGWQTMPFQASVRPVSIVSFRSVCGSHPSSAFAADYSRERKQDELGSLENKGGNRFT